MSFDCWGEWLAHRAGDGKPYPGEQEFEDTEDETENTPESTNGVTSPAVGFMSWLASVIYTL